MRPEVAPSSSSWATHRCPIGCSAGAPLAGHHIQLPPAATLLASSLACPEQLFRINPRPYRLQCHIEVTAAALERWIVEDASFVRAALGAGGADRIRADAGRWLGRSRRCGGFCCTNC